MTQECFDDLKIYIEKYDPNIHSRAVRKFDCGNPTINRCLCNSEKFDATTILFFNYSNNELIGYCSYCCSSIRICKESIAECYPAMEIKLFGISQKYQGSKFLFEDRHESVSIFIFKYILSRLKFISDNHIFSSYIILYALPEVTGFYEKNQFEFISEDKEVLKGYFSEGCVPMYLPI